MGMGSMSMGGGRSEEERTDDGRGMGTGHGSLPWVPRYCHGGHGLGPVAGALDREGNKSRTGAFLPLGSQPTQPGREVSQKQRRWRNGLSEQVKVQGQQHYDKRPSFVNFSRHRQRPKAGL